MNELALRNFLSSGTFFSAPDGDFWVGWDFAPNRGEVSVYAPDFFLNSETAVSPWLHPRQFRKLTRPELVAFLSAPGGTGLELTWEWEAPALESFQKVFEELQAAFYSGSLKKAVPVVFEKAQVTVTPETRRSLLLNLLGETHGSPLHLYGVWNESEGVLGATPEVLLELGGRQVHTAALAGTRPNESTQPPLLDDPKERIEHQHVIDGIRAAFAGLGAVEFRTGETRELRLATLSHLYTPIEVVLRDKQPFDRIVQALHPTPALGAVPREAGLRWLRSQQRQVDRRRFGAPIGLVTEAGEAFCLVAIRNIQWKNDEVLLGSGCGVISESRVEREWAELAAKRASVKKLLGLR